ncbi:hypothetical protein C9374_014552 [Naegleria lovaniensis]|uniref:Uncharacterized protein n=1 Tax=Naegleria lovaniensis TaxID=51637 RepID=A0AA88GUJ3_NAELO|nr:uncharacterized protein C9374_014552 [Naegleria lovaniensis]KAG2389152.1 hypothetical protein C9374_014552 [Naegleria lovaniensis]
MSKRHLFDSTTLMMKDDGKTISETTKRRKYKLNSLNTDPSSLEFNMHHDPSYLELTRIPFNGKIIHFKHSSKLKDLFEIRAACRENKPCCENDRKARMCFYATCKWTGQNVVLKTLSDQTSSMVDVMKHETLNIIVDNKTIRNDTINDQELLLEEEYLKISQIPAQCFIDEYKKQCGLNAMGTNYCKLYGRIIRNEGETKWTTEKDIQLGATLNFTIDDSILTSYIIINDEDKYRETLHQALSKNSKLLTTNSKLDLEAMKITLFKFAFTRDNAFVNTLIKRRREISNLHSDPMVSSSENETASSSKEEATLDNSIQLLSIDEENYGDNYIKNAKKNGITLEDQYELTIASKCTKEFLKRMKDKSKTSSLIDFLERMKQVEPLPFEGFTENVDALMKVVKRSSIAKRKQKK